MKIYAGLLFLATSLQPYLMYDCLAASVTSAIATSSTSSGAITCGCSSDYKPVCGTNGRSYSNECILRCISAYYVENGRPPIYVKTKSECPQPPCKCTKFSDPVCGSDNNTYINECFVGCENTRRNIMNLPPIGVAYRGPCKITSCICPDVIVPLCGTDNKTYRNLCILQCASLINQANGLPPIEVQNGEACVRESCECSIEVDPVCATDGNTYSNPCLLRCQNRRRNHIGQRPLAVQYRGKCLNCVCSPTYDPVCGSDGHTYANPCTLGCENQKRKELGKLPIVINSQDVCPCTCNSAYEPVCGTDERTYVNKCHLRCENKKRGDLGMPQISVAYVGRCACNCDYCRRYFDPVCGSDGITYWNKCWLDCNKVCNSDIGRPLYLVGYGLC